MIDPLLRAELEAALFCQVVKRSAARVAEVRRALHVALIHLEEDAVIAQRSFDDAVAMKKLREKSAATSACGHTYPVPGPMIPRVYGSGPTECCLACGAWRPAWFVNARWRDKDTLAEAMKEDDGR